jgi:hypothetical protein
VATICQMNAARRHNYRESVWWLRWFAVGCSAMSVVLALGAIAADEFRGVINFGDVGGWLAGVGSISAAVAAVGVALYGNRRENTKANDEREKSKERALRRARRIVLVRDRFHMTLQQTGQAGVGTYNAYSVQLVNNGSSPIYDVEWKRPLVVHIPYFPPNKQVVPEVRVATDVVMNQNRKISVLGGDLVVVEPGNSMDIVVEMEFIRHGARQRPMPFNTYYRVSYVDDDGYKMGRVYDRINESAPATDPDSYRGRWELVDDGYPDNVIDAIHQFVEWIPKPAPAPEPE